MNHTNEEMKAIEYEEVMIHLLKLQVQWQGIAAKSMKLEITPMERQQIRYRLTTLMPAEILKEKTEKLEVSYPDGWFQALKEHLPNWFVKRYQTRYITKIRTVKLTAYQLYPKLDLPVDFDLDHRIVMTDDIDNQVKDRFDAGGKGENPCDRCRWMDEVEDTDFPCSHCIHNVNHVKE